MSDAESHGPTETWTIWVCDNCGHWHGASYAIFTDEKPPLCKIKGYGQDRKTSCGSVMRRVVVARPERVCQELAEALREKARAGVKSSPFQAGAVEAVAEFVERFGKADR